MRRNRSAAAAVALLALSACAYFQKPPPPAPGFDASESGAAKTFLALSAMREDKGDLAGALQVVDKALANQPHSRAAALRRAELLLALDRRAHSSTHAPEAREIIDRAAAAAPGADDPNLVMAQARLAWNEGRRDDAIAMLRGADALPAAQCMLAAILLEQGDAPGALAAAERALQLDPASISAHRERARTRLALADAAGAADDAHEALRASPDEADARILLAGALERQGRGADAIRALEVLPADGRTPATRVALARLQLAAGHADLARPLLEEAAGGAPQDAAVLEALLALDRSAPMPERASRLGDSLARLDSAAAARPDDAQLARVHGEALAAAGRPAEAEASFARAIQLDADDISLYGPLAEALVAKRSREQALARAIQLGLGPGPAHHLIGAIYEAQGDRARALDAYADALRDDPAPVASRIAVALGLSSSKDAKNLERALALAREARAARPCDRYAVHALGVVLLLRGQTADALDPLRAAVGAWPVDAPDLGEVRYHLALAYEKSGQRDAAHELAQAAADSAAKARPEPAWARDARALAARVAPPKERLAPLVSHKDAGAAPEPEPSAGAAEQPAGSQASTGAPAAPSAVAEKRKSP